MPEDNIGENDTETLTDTNGGETAVNCREENGAYGSETANGGVSANGVSTDGEPLGTELYDSGETDENAALSGAFAAKSSEAPAKDRVFRLQKPVIIASVIMLASVLFFVCWGLFFNSSIHGTWKLDFTAAGKECSVTFSFDKDGTCQFRNGGVIYKGSYTTNENSGGRNKLTMKYTRFGQPMIDAYLYYDVGGNAFSGRTLRLTDISGLVYSPETSDSGTSANENASSADFMEENGVRYFVYTLRSVNDEVKNVPIENAATDEKLTGIWLEINADSNYDNTFAFYEDGTYQITYRDVVYKGCYSAKDGEYTFNIKAADESVMNNALSYSFKDEKLVITINGVPATLVPVESEYAFDTGIK